MPNQLPRYDLDRWRRSIPLLTSAIPMNNCSQAPQTEATRAAAERYLESWNRSGMDWESWMAEVALARAQFARLIGAPPEAIAVTSSVSEATSMVASALDFSGRRRVVVVTEAEFPTMGQIWLAQERRGARVEWVPIREGRVRLEDYEPKLGSETALVCACHGYFLNGAVQDIGAVAERVHAVGGLLYVDAYQTLGTRPVNVHALGVDFLASGCLKFLMGVPGIAFLYVRPELIERLEPTVTGWFGRKDPFSFQTRQLDWSATASRFDTGTPPILNAYVARAGMEIIDSVGIGAIGEWHAVLAGRLIVGGRARGLILHGGDDASRKTASTAFVVPDAGAVETAMRAQGVIASARGPVLRLAPHFYSTETDVDLALDVLVDVLARR
jgi:selenocysteine lyase/cysteine desulfurase